MQKSDTHNALSDLLHDETNEWKMLTFLIAFFFFINKIDQGRLARRGLYLIHDVCTDVTFTSMYALFTWFLLDVSCSWQGMVVALDKIKSKVEKISENAKALQLHCIKAHCYNSIQAICSDLTHDCGTGTDQITFP